MLNYGAGCTVYERFLQRISGERSLFNVSVYSRKNASYRAVKAISWVKATARPFTFVKVSSRLLMASNPRKNRLKFPGASGAKK